MAEEEEQEPIYYNEAVRDAIYRHRRADPDKIQCVYAKLLPAEERRPSLERKPIEEM